MTPTTTPTEFVSLTGRGSQLFVWSYFAVTAILAIWTISDSRAPLLVPLVLALYAGVCAATTLDPRPRLSLPASIATIAVGPISVLLLSPHIRDGGYTAWYVGAATGFLFLLSIRERILLAAIGCVLLVAALMVVTTTPTAVTDAALVGARQSAIVATGMLFAVGIRRTSRDIRRVTAAASERAASEAAAVAAAAERSRRLADLETAVGPLLTKIASGSPITDADAARFAAAEAELRDSLRARGLRRTEIVEAARGARSRGVDVVLLDDSDPAQLDQARLAEFSAVVAEALREAPDGRVTVRLLPPGRDHLGTVVVDGSVYEKYEV